MLSLKKEVYELYKPVLLKYKSLFLLLGVTGLISGLSSIIMPVLLKMETDQLVSKKGEIFGITLFSAFDVFIIILGIMLIVSIIERILNSITGIFTKAKNDLLKNELQLNMFKKMENMEMGRSMNSRYKHISSIVDDEFRSLTDQIMNIPGSLIEFFVKLFGITLIYAYFDIKLLFIVIGFSIFGYFINKIIRKIAKKYEIDWNFSLGRQAWKYSHLFMDKLPELATSGGIKSTLKGYQILLDKEVENGVQKDFSTLSRDVTRLINSSLLDITLKLIVGYGVFYGTASVGMVVLVISSMHVIESIVNDILNFKQKYSDYIFRQESIVLILQICEKVGNVNYEEKIDKIEFKNIIFSYPNLAKYEKDYLDIVQKHIIGKDLGDNRLDKRIKSMIENIEEEIGKDNDIILNNLNFTFEKGKVYGIVGKNGAGKTSIMYLLAGFFRNYSGEILLNSTNSIDFTTTSFLDKVSFLNQVPFDMGWNSTIRENLLLGSSENIDDNKIYHYLEKFGLDKKIKKQKKGLDAMIGDDIEFSGGETQIIAFIRILLQDRDIIIMDEGTNQLDAENEIKVMNELLKNKHDKIIIFVTHRMSTISKADEIYCLEDGFFANHGKHKDLLKSGENLYAKFYKTQINHEE